MRADSSQRPTTGARERAAPEDSPQELKRRAIKGFVWSSGAFISQKGLVFVSTLVLARLLDPADFGIVAFALAITAYLARLTDLGMSAALVQRRDASEPRVYSTVFWLANGSGLVLFAVCWVIAPYVADLGGNPLITDVFRALAGLFVIASLGAARAGLLQHSLEFEKLAVPQVASGLAKGIVSIALAVGGAGVWSLVAGQLAGALVGLVVLWVVSPWLPKLVFERRQVRSLLTFGLGVTAVGIIAEGVINVDYLIVGARLGETALGLYYLAFRLPELAVGSVSQVSWSVLFPLYSRLHEAVDDEDGERLRRGYLKTVRLGSLVTLPIGFGIAALSTPLVVVLFGSKWREAGDAMALIAVFACLNGLAGMPGTIFKSLGRTGLMTANALVYLVVLVPPLWVAAGHSIEAVAATHVLVQAAIFVYLTKVGERVLGLPWHRTFTTLAPALLVSVIMGGAVYGTARVLPAGAALAVGIPLGAAVYLALLRSFFTDDLHRLLDLARDLRRRPAETPGL
jgi:PST family polysaccharide transporter